MIFLQSCRGSMKKDSRKEKRMIECMKTAAKLPERNEEKENKKQTEHNLHQWTDYRNIGLYETF